MCKFNMFITAVCILFLIKLRWPKNKSINEETWRKNEWTINIVFQRILVYNLMFRMLVHKDTISISRSLGISYCLVPVGLSPRPSRSIDFGDVSPTNGLSAHLTRNNLTVAILRPRSWAIYDRQILLKII